MSGQPDAPDGRPLSYQYRLRADAGPGEHPLRLEVNGMGDVVEQHAALVEAALTERVESAVTVALIESVGRSHQITLSRVLSALREALHPEDAE